MSQSKRPNILFCIADDASHMSAYGHKFVNTPNFDWIADQGVLFTNAYTTNPKCAPSRASICTGMHTWQLEEACCHVEVFFPEKLDTYADVLGEAGYHVGHTGKGWSPGDWQTNRKTNPAGPVYNDIKLTPPEDTCINPCDYTANFEAFLSEKEEGQPFCFWYGCYEPHRHYAHGEGLRHGKEMSMVESLPSYWPDDEVVKTDLLDYAYETDCYDLHIGQMLDVLRERGELDNTIIVATSDNGCPFPRVKGQMYQQDFNLPLAICWPKLSNGGRVIDDLVSFTDFAPTFLEAAGLDIHPQMSGRSMMDLITSDESGVISDCRDMVTMGRENHDGGREGDKGYPVRCIRKGDYLYVRNFTPNRWPAGNPETQFTNCDGSPTKDLILEMNEQGQDYYFNLCFGKRPFEQLFDVVKDPECMENLADKEDFAALKESLWKELEAYLIKTEDPRILGNGDVFDGYVVERWHKTQASWQAYLDGRWELPPFLDWKKHIK